MISRANTYCIFIIAFAVLMLAFGCKKNTALSSADEDKGNFITTLFSSSSEPKMLEPLEYVEWCEDEENGLKQTKEIGEFEFSAFMKPIDYLALKEVKDYDHIDQKKMAASKKEYEGLIYFSFRIKNTQQQNELLKINLSSESDYYGRIEYFSFKMQNDFKLITGNDTAACALYHFERIYGLAPYATFVIGFPASNKNEDMKLWYHDEIFNNGIIMLNFKKELVNNMPKLKI